ncbi:Protein prenyltransferase alpha subunit repeat-containing protein 1 [Boothiomyces sp. JEL0866]|nr:Protein prenyltransferase alpha subunit repeat-containing protein 1 [Boothiomyces sp. JEL0866]
MKEIFRQLVKTLENEKLDGDLDFILNSPNNLPIIAEGNLGIPATNIVELYNYAWEEFQSGNNNATWILVVINPDCYTAWNKRKRLLLENRLDMSQEYNFTRLILTKHCAKSMLWAHRLWVRKNMKSDSNLLADLDKKICRITADRYRCNYPCWQFRRAAICNKSKLDTILEEIEKSNEFVKSHISDSSGWSYRIYLFDNEFDMKNLLEKELEWTKGLICVFPNHESLYLHLRGIYLLSAKYLISPDLVYLESLDSSVHGKYPNLLLKYFNRRLK